MSIKIPSFFKVKTSTEKRELFPLNHKVVTTTDFFRVQPILCREMVPNDKFVLDMESFARFTPMPFPTIGHIQFFNRAFFVPYRLIMKDFNDFIEENATVDSQGRYKASNVPVVYNNALCDMFMLEENSSVNDKLTWVEKSSRDSSIYFLSSPFGVPYYFTHTVSSVTYYYSLVYQPSSGNYVAFGLRSISGYELAGVYENNTFTFSADAPIDAFEATFPDAQPEIDLTGYVAFVDHQPLNFEDIPLYSDLIADFIGKDGQAHRFTNSGRLRYNLLLSLGYRVDFSSSSGSWSNLRWRSAGKLLAYLRVFLDYYVNPAFEGYQALYKYFQIGRQVSGFTAAQLNEITQFFTAYYDKDYFTAAWQDPATPNGSEYGSNYFIADQIGPNDIDPTNTSVMASSATPISRPRVWLQEDNSFSQYIIDTLKDLSNYLHRHQLAGYRTVDRYLAEFGVKLSDDKSNRCYYLGSNNFSAQIGDVMSTSETVEAKLGDYAGKGIAYGSSNNISYENSQEYGYFIVIGSCVPEIGYVQGMDAENYHINPLDFHRAQFDNLGTQAINNDELFLDYGMPGLDGQGVVTRPQNFDENGVFGFIPRYAEYKVGRDFLTGDFAIPSRRTGMDSFHLYRLFSGREDINLDNAFTLGEQEQYDRVFNNQSSEYDHIRIVHRLDIKAYRPMKSISETIDWDDDLGREVDIPAQGQMLN